MNNKQILKTLLIILLLSDTIFSFIQYYRTPLHGDIETGIFPDKYVKQIFDDPFGFHAITSGEKHVNPNRFFSHYFFMKYVKNAPRWLQRFVSPISSIYLSCALIKIAVQILFIYLLSIFISKKGNILSKEFLISAIIIAPLFQVYGYWSRMGINDQSIVYTFFYAIPIVLLIIFLIPIFNKIYHNSKIKKLYFFFSIPAIIALPLSSPLIPGIVLIISFLVFVGYIRIAQSNGSLNFRSFFKLVTSEIFLFLFPISIVSLYSLFLGFYDSNYISETISIYDRYSSLPKGIFSQLFHSLGFPLMLLVIGINTYILFNKYRNDAQSKKLINTLKWIGLFSMLYIFLLPLGGYRPYRANILRYDTIMPVTIVLIYFFAASTYFLIIQVKGKINSFYLAFVVVCLLIYTFSDLKGLDENKIERQSLKAIASSSLDVVPLPPGAFVMSWDNLTDYRQSDKKAKLLQYWGVTKEKKLFYNEPR